MTRILDPDAPFETAVHLRRYPRALGTAQWAVSNANFIPAETDAFTAIGRPALGPGGAAILVGGAEGNQTTIFRASANTGTFDENTTVTVDGDSTASFGGLVIDSGGTIYVGGPGDLIARFDSDLSPLDPLPLGEAYGNGSIFWDLQIDDQDNLVFDILLCTETCSFLTTKASPNGEVAWSDALVYADQPIPLWAGATALAPGRVASAVSSAQGLSYIVRNSQDGSVLEEGELDLGGRYDVTGMTIDPQGLLAIAAVNASDNGESLTSWIGRIDPATGEEVWSREIAFEGQTVVYDVTHATGGRIYVTGLADVTITGLPSGALIGFGEAWIAAFEA